MKILINITGVKPLFYDKGGAIQKLVSYQVDDLRKDHQLIVIGQLAKETKGIKLIFHKKKLFDYSLISLIFEGVRGSLKIWRQEADLIISTHPSNFFASFLYSKLKRKPLVAWEMDHVFWVEPEIMVKKIYHFLVGQADRIIVLSQIQKKRMIKKRVKPSKITVIPAAVDTKKFALSKQEKEKYILSVGKFTESKNQMMLLKAFEKLNSQKRIEDFSLYLVGPFSGAFTAPNTQVSKYYRQCLDYIRKNDLEEKVGFYQNITEKELVSLYQRATLFVFPSLEEAFGVGLLEAMACGCPCVANNIQPLSEILGKTGKIVDASRAEILTREMEKFLLDQQLAERMAKRARERAVSRFNTQIVSKKFRDLILSFQKRQK